MRISYAVFISLLVFALGCSKEQSAPVEFGSTRPARTDVAQRESEPRTTRPRFYDRVHVLCIGINEYRYPTRALNEAESDARLFGETLKQQFGYEPHYLEGSQATKRAIEERIVQLGNSLHVDEALIVFFAGHGTAFQRIEHEGNIPIPTRVGYLLPSDAEVDLSNPQDPAWKNEAIDMRWLVDAIDQLKAHHVLLVADCCCSGFMTKRGGVEIGTQINLLKNSSRSILAATTQHEAASEGVFTRQFLDVVGKYSQRGEVASVTDIFDEVRGPVVRASDRNMTPQLAHIGEGDGEFLFFPLAVPEESVRVIKDEVLKARTTESSNMLSSAGNTRGLLSGVVSRALKRTGQRTTLSEISATISAPPYWYGLQAAEQTNYWQAMRERFHKNAARGDLLAMVALHFCYSRGLGEAEETPDPNAAYRWALAAEQMAPESGVGKCLLGRCYRLGIGIEQNQVTGRQLYRESAADGFILGKLFDAQRSLLESRSRETFDECLPILVEGVDAGIALAAAIIADSYATGKLGIEQNIAKATSLYEKAFELGAVAASAQLYSGYTYELPGFPKQDLALSEKYLRVGAEKGVADCQFFLGIEHLQCRALANDFRWFLGFEKDVAKGLQWIELAARQGHWPALVTLAEIYGEGKEPSVAMNLAKAREYVEKGVEHDAVNAMVLQARWYSSDTGIYPQDLTKSLQCYERAAARGSAFACRQVGYYYEEAMGLEIPTRFKNPDGSFSLHPKSHVAMHWYIKSLQNGGDDLAGQRLDRFRRLLVNEQRGVVPTRGFNPSFVLGIWRMNFPDSARDFDNRFWESRPFPNVEDRIKHGAFDSR